MKQHVTNPFLSIFTLVCVLLLLSCKANSDKTAPDEQKKITVSIPPQLYLAKQIVGDRVGVDVLLPSGSNPESYDPTPRQMMQASDSEAFFLIGLFPFEQKWIANLKDTSPQKLIFTNEHLADEEHHHHHVHGDVHSDHPHSQDPHIWMAPSKMKQMAFQMFQEISRIDTVNALFYEENYLHLEKKLDSLHHTIQEILYHSPSRTFAIYHPALTYFAKDYQLEQLSLENEGKQPTPRQLSQLIIQAKEKKARVVFIQPEFDAKNAQTVAHEIGAQVVKIDPLSPDWDNEVVRIAQTIAQP